MADYIPIIATETDPEAPLRSSLLKRLEANPRAIAEGAPGAPRVMPLSRKLVIFSGAVTTSPITITGLDPDIYVSMYGFINVSGSSGNATVQMRFSSDGGATFGAWSDLTAASIGNVPASGQERMLSLRNGRILIGHGSNSSGQPFLLTSDYPVNAIGFRVNGTGTLQGASIYLIGEGRND